MSPELATTVVCGLVGLLAQRSQHGDRVRELLWSANYAVVIPLAAIYAFLAIDIDVQLVQVVACGVAAWWLTVLLAFGYGRLAGRGDRRTVGALTLLGAFPNTSFIGFPLASLAFGTEGLQLAVVYDQVSLVVPAIVVATVFARTYSHADGAPSEAPDSSLLRAVLLSPPLWTVAAVLLARATFVHDAVELRELGAVIGHVVGPLGFVLLGLSVPLHRFDHARGEVAAVTGAVAVRLAVAPASLLLVTRVAGVDAPDALYLIAAMPTAFHALIIARMHDLAPGVVRLGLLGSTAISVVGTVTWIALRGGG